MRNSLTAAGRNRRRLGKDPIFRELTKFRLLARIGRACHNSDIEATIKWLKAIEVTADYLFVHLRDVLWIATNRHTSRVSGASMNDLQSKFAITLVAFGLLFAYAIRTLGQAEHEVDAAMR